MCGARAFAPRRPPVVCVGADQVALHVLQPAEGGDHRSSGAGDVSAHGSAGDRVAVCSRMG